MGVSRNPEKPYKISDERFYTDTDKWENEVESLIGPTDVTFIQMETTLQTGTLIQRGKLPLPVPCFQGLPLFLQCGCQQASLDPDGT